MKLLLKLIITSLCFLITTSGFAQSYPNKPIKLIVPFPPGGPTDIVARPLAQMLGESMKQSVIVENKGGAGGSVAADFVAKSPPDGYTIMVGTVGTHAINGSLYRQLPYDMTKDFTPIALVASAPLVIAVPANSNIKTLADLIKEAKAKPDFIAFGTAGNGTPGHLTGALFETATKT
ncbi:MAG: Bug family tripartite tricarboxylate transporter substrate binding protein, partial [Polynucleobacter sp.]